jgi:hypothetical protein
MTLIKYPRTPHLEGSRLQPGDEDLDQVPFREVAGKHLVIEEKVDGANAGLRFGPDGQLLLQSRGHFLQGGPRERQWDLFKTWAACRQRDLGDVLGTRYVLFGEWLYAKHTVFYDRLPHYFLEFDVLDTATGAFLATDRRRALLEGLPLASVRVLHQGPLNAPKELAALIGPSAFQSPRWRERLVEVAREERIDPERVLRETDLTGIMEGLYVKWEEDGRVRGRYKFIRPSFSSQVLSSGSHWADRPILPNQLAPGADLFAG